MLTELKLANFKVFADEVTVRFRPITVFIGGNNAGKTAVIDFLTLLHQTPANSPYQFPCHEKTFLNGINRGTFLEPFANMRNGNSANQALRFALTTRLPAAVRSDQPERPFYCRAVAAADYQPNAAGLVKYALLNREGKEVLQLPAATTPRWCDQIPAAAPERQLTFAAARSPTRNGNAARSWNDSTSCGPRGNIPSPPSQPIRCPTTEWTGAATALCPALKPYTAIRIPPGTSCLPTWRK